MEEWRLVKGYEECYAVSSYGRVKRITIKNSSSKEKILALADRKGYAHVVLCKNGKRKDMSVHRLVAEAFIPNPNNYPYINHKDENKSNNKIENLEWCTAKYNSNYGTSLARRSITRIKNHCNAKKVLVYNSNGELINRFNSVTECGKYYGTHRSNIHKYIINNHKYKNNYFRYDKDNSSQLGSD